TDRSSAQWEQNGRAMELAGRGFISTGTILSGLLSAGIVTATKTASEMEDAFTGIMKVTDMTDQEYRGLERTIMQMSTRIPASFEEIAGAMEIAGRLGIEGSDNIEKFAETVLMMGVATEMSAEDAADSMARFMNIKETLIGSGLRLLNWVRMKVVARLRGNSQHKAVTKIGEGYGYNLRVDFLICI